MKTLKEDIFSPLYDVERPWLRIPVTLFLTVFLLITAVICSVCDGIYFTIKCLKGEN